MTIGFPGPDDERTITPRGIMARARRTTSAAAAGTAVGSATGALRLALPRLIAGRLYRFRAEGAHSANAVSNNVGFQLTYTTAAVGDTPATPTPGSTVMEQAYWTTSAIAGQLATWSLTGILVPADHLAVTVLLSYWRNSGSATCTMFGSAAVPVDLTVEDLGGADPGSTGVVL